MQRPDEKKRQCIVAAALKLFATRPFHEVRLEDVAAAAKVGKGTVYIYFKSKEHLYGSLISEGFAQLVDGLKSQLAENGEPAWDALRKIVRELVGFSVAHPYVYKLMRIGGPEDPKEAALVAKRRELGKLVEGARGEQLQRRRHDALTFLFVGPLHASMRGKGESCLT